MDVDSGNPTGGSPVYDVLFLDRVRGEKLIASGLSHDDACQLARAESQRRGVGRMFLAGSELGPTGDMIVIVESAAHAV
jgi:hypothetical protein